MRAIDIAKIVSGFILVAVGIGLYMYDMRTEDLYVQSFSEEPVQIVGLTSRTYTEGDLPQKIRIPEREISISVKRAPIMNGYWEVFDDTAGWGEGSGIPGEPGNQVIFAHAKKGLFLPLRDVEKEDMITVETKNETFYYKVMHVDEVSPKNTNIIAPTEDETLTLYTCSGYKDTKRFIVIAKRVLEVHS